MSYAIVGIGLADCLGTDLNLNWQRYISGDSPIQDISNFALEEYPVIKVKQAYQIDDSKISVDKWLSPQEVRPLDRFSLIGFYTAAKAIEEANIAGKENTAVIYSSLGSGNKSILERTKNLLDGKRSTPRQALATQRDGISGLISRKFGFYGMNITLTSACASGINAIDYACRLLKDGVYDQVVVGGCDVMVDPMDIYMFQSIGALDTREIPISSPFDKNRNGFVMGEGSAAFVIKRLDKAQADGNVIHAIVRGVGFANEAYHETDIEKTGLGARLSIDMALQQAGLAHTDIGIVNAHATSTPNGDEIEYSIIKEYFSTAGVMALKGNIGHTMAACGLVEMSYLIETLKNSLIGPVANLTDPIDSDYTFPSSANSINARYGLKNSFGFGGKSAAIVLETYNEKL